MVAAMNIAWLPPHRQGLEGVATFYSERRMARQFYLDGFTTRADYRLMLSVTIALERGLITLGEAYECLRWSPLTLSKVS